MNKEQKNYAKAADLLGKAFIRMPRKVLNMAIQPVKKERRFAVLYITLITRAFFTDGVATLGNHKYICRRGEYVGTYLELSKFTGISIGSIGYYLRLLELDHLIVMNTMTGGSRIGICNYEYFSGRETEKNDEYPDAGRKAFKSMSAAESEIGGRSMQDMNRREERGNAG